MMILDKLKQLVSTASAPSEQATERNGAFSYRSETHAFVWGLSLGTLLILTLRYFPEQTMMVFSPIAALVSYAFLDRREKARAAPVPESVAREAEKEPQYLAGGLFVGVWVGVVLVAVLAAVGV